MSLDRVTEPNHSGQLPHIPAVGPTQAGPTPAGSTPVVDQPVPPGVSPVSAMLSVIGELLTTSELAHEQFREARHNRARAEQFAAAAAKAAGEGREAQARAVAERHKASPHKQLNRQLGTALAVVLAVLDALPAYWSAEAFGLNQVSTLVIAGLLCAALGGAMWMLDMFVDRQRHAAARVLGCALAAGFAGIFALRLDYLMVTQGSGVLSASIQALALTGLSAALVAVGFVLLSHRVPKAVAEAESAAHQSKRRHDKKLGDDLYAKAAMSQAALADTVIAWALGRGSAGIGHDELIRATNEALAVLLSQ